MRGNKSLFYEIKGCNDLLIKFGNFLLSQGSRNGFPYTVNIFISTHKTHFYGLNQAEIALYGINYWFLLFTVC